MNPTLGHGKICYVGIPSADVERSAAFYAALFRWEIRKRSNGTTAFNDSVGQVSGAFVPGRPRKARPACCSTSWSTTRQRQ